MTTDEARLLAAECQAAMQQGPMGNAETLRFLSALAAAVGDLTSQLEAHAAAEDTTPDEPDVPRRKKH